MASSTAYLAETSAVPWGPVRTDEGLDSPPVTNLTSSASRDRSLFPSWSWVGWKNFSKGDPESIHEDLDHVPILEWHKNSIKGPLYINSRSGDVLYRSSADLGIYTKLASPECHEEKWKRIFTLHYEIGLFKGLPRSQTTQQLRDLNRHLYKICDHSLWVTGLVLNLDCEINTTLLDVINGVECAERLTRIDSVEARQFVSFDLQKFPYDAETWFLDAGVTDFVTRPRTLNFLVMDIKAVTDKYMRISLMCISWNKGVAEGRGVLFLAIAEPLVSLFFRFSEPRIESFWLN